MIAHINVISKKLTEIYNMNERLLELSSEINDEVNSLSELDIKELSPQDITDLRIVVDAFDNFDELRLTINSVNDDAYSEWQPKLNDVIDQKTIHEMDEDEHEVESSSEEETEYEDECDLYRDSDSEEESDDE